MTSLDKKVSKDDSDETVLGDFIVSDEMSVEGTAINNVSGEWLWDMIKSILTTKEYDIIKEDLVMKLTIQKHLNILQLIMELQEKEYVRLKLKP